MRALWLALILCGAASNALAKEASQDFPVQGWSCPNCCGRTEKAVLEVKGVTAAKADFEKKQIAVTYDDTLATPDQIRSAIEKAGHSCPLPKKK